MFKKSLSTLKTSAPLKNSDRRKLKQRVIVSYGITNEEGDVLVPDGILSVKFNNHVGEPGVRSFLVAFSYRRLMIRNISRWHI